MMLNIESTLHYLRMKVLYKLTYLVFLYILYSVFHEAWENEWSCFGGRFCCMFSVLPAFYSEFYFSLTSQQPVICVTSAFKETTLELSHLSLNGPTELCCTPPPPPVKRCGWSACVLPFMPQVWSCCYRLVISTGTVDSTAGDTRRGSAALVLLTGWKADQTLSAKPLQIAALHSVCVCVCVF